MHGPPRHYSYRVDHDLNFAPHIWRGVATVCGCKITTIEQWAKVGSWVVGIGGKNTGQSDRLLYAMRVTNVPSFNEFKRRHPANAAYLKGKGVAPDAQVLVSRGQFYYFGVNAIKIPAELAHIIHPTQGCKRLFEEDVRMLEALLSSWTPGKHGLSNNDGERSCRPCPPANKLFDTDAQGSPPCGSYSLCAGQLRR